MAMSDKTTEAEKATAVKQVVAFVSLCFLAGAVICAFLGQASIGVAIAGVTIVGIVKSLVDQRRAK